MAQRLVALVEENTQEEDYGTDAQASRRQFLRTIQSLQEQMNRLAAEQLVAIAEFAKYADEPKGVPRELALGLSITRQRAENQVELARALTTRLPETLNAMRRGRIDGYKASKIHEPTMHLTDEQAREVDVIMGQRIERKTPEGLRRSTNLAVATVDPDGYAQRCRKRRQDRRVELLPLDDGMVKLSADLPVEVGVAAYARIDAEAHRRRKQDKSKTLEQHRADIFADLLLKDSSGVKVGPRAEIFVYLDFYTWLNLNIRPAEMAGRGIIPAWLAHEIANGDNTTLRRLITDPDTGQIMSVGRTSYRPPADLARLIYTRNRECRTPTCHRPAQECELDHAQDWHAEQGETAEHNLIAYCSYDHHLKDLTGWDYHLDPDTGCLTITTPTGDHYTSEPEPLHSPRPNPLPDCTPTGSADPPPF